MPLPSSLNESLSNQIISQESDQLLSKLKSTSYNIALDSRGKQYKSEEFADFIAKVQNNYSEITFIIGGSLGLSNTLKEKCTFILVKTIFISSFSSVCGVYENILKDISLGK